jgi:predicted RNase H-like HicB family nuclease
MRYSISLIWSTEDEAYLATVPELPGCSADGSTPEEALKNLRVVVEEWIETANELKRPVPEPVDVVKAQRLNELFQKELGAAIQKQIDDVVAHRQFPTAPRLSVGPQKRFEPA